MSAAPPNRPKNSRYIPSNAPRILPSKPQKPAANKTRVYRSKRNENPTVAPEPNNRPNNVNTPVADVNGAATTRPPRQKPFTRILVKGYPSYTLPHDLLEVFSKFGNVRLEKCDQDSAILKFKTKKMAAHVVAASGHLHIYGHFLTVEPDFRAKGPKRDFTKTNEKSIIITPDKIDLSGNFQSQLGQVLAAIRLTQEDVIRINAVFTDVENILQAQWPGCKAIPFGSITTGLGIKTSDADCFVLLPPQFHRADGNHVKPAANILMQQPQTFTEILPIARANTPIVKFYYVPADVNCDLSFKTLLGTRNSRLIGFLLRSDARFLPMAVVIKYWAKVHGVSGKNRLTNYALVILIIFYLQQKSMLPSVAWLQKDRSDDFIVDYWNTGFMNNSLFLPPVSSSCSVAELLGGFFEYYSMFNFDEMVVCPYLGVPINKEAFKDTKSLPDEFKLYKDNILNNHMMAIRFETPFCVQDPFEQCHNVASPISKKLASDIQIFFKFGADAYMKEKLNDYDNFLKIILLEAPKLIPIKSKTECSFSISPKTINTITSDDWKSVIREKINIVFKNMMKLQLEKIEKSENTDSSNDTEEFTCTVTKPVWKRKRYNFYFAPNQGVEERQTIITEEILRKERQHVNLQLQLIVTFVDKPRDAKMTIRMDEGSDNFAFQQFGKCFKSKMQSWIIELLKSHLRTVRAGDRTNKK